LSRLAACVYTARRAFCCEVLLASNLHALHTQNIISLFFTRSLLSRKVRLSRTRMDKWSKICYFCFAKNNKIFKTHIYQDARRLKANILSRAHKRKMRVDGENFEGLNFIPCIKNALASPWHSGIGPRFFTKKKACDGDE
jgi:hypothetical protein